MPQFQPFDWYQQPLYYDIIFDADTDREADFLTAVYRAHGRGGDPAVRRGLRVLEPACGTGRLVAAMAERGHHVVGVDLAEPALAFARERLQQQGLQAELIRQDMAAIDRPDAGPCDLAHCLVSSFKYLLTEDAATAHLRGVARALRPGGLYVLGLHLSDYQDPDADIERWVASRDGVRVHCTIKGWPPDQASRTEQVRARLSVRDQQTVGEPLRLESHWTFRTYDLPELHELLHRVPNLRHVATYGFDCGPDLAGEQPLDGQRLDNVLVLRKR